MNIKCLKNLLLESFEPINYKKENKNNTIIYMLYYLIAYDIICLIILCYFISGSLFAGAIKIIYQIVHFYFNSKMIKKFNMQMNIFSIIKSKIENTYLIRKWNIFNSEGYLVIEFLCNFIIIFDILLIVYICRKKNYTKKEKNKEKFKEKIKEKTKEKIKEKTKEKIKEKTKEIPKEIPKEISKEISKENDEKRINKLKIQMFERQKNLRKNNQILNNSKKIENNLFDSIENKNDKNDKNKNEINEEKIKNKKINETLEDMCIYGNIMKEEIL